eukprot:2435556-Rhodomonas_salina.2
MHPRSPPLAPSLSAGVPLHCSTQALPERMFSSVALVLRRRCIHRCHARLQHPVQSTQRKASGFRATLWASPSRNLLTNFAGRRLQERLMTLASKGPAMELEDGQEQKLVIAEYMNHVGCASAAGDDFAKSPDREKVPSSPISPALPSFFPSFVLRAKRALPHRADRDGSGQESNYRPPC